MILAFAFGCTPITTMREDGSTVHHYVGYVRVITPPSSSTTGSVQVVEVSGTGVRFHNGIGLGYFREREEVIPLDCRLVVHVANQQQLDEVIQTLSPITKEGLCVVVDRP
ncbi:MAG TPA: hypothetical protein VL171_15610 [Verrucomicrobiae bacterium]|nr:hypothetical protein [Verrucomicrobiae bacterium]